MQPDPHVPYLRRPPSSPFSVLEIRFTAPGGPGRACKIVPRRMPTPLGLNPWPSHLPAATVILLYSGDARRSVPLYYFKLVDSIIVADHGVHELVDDDAARVEAIRLARSLRETRPQLRGSHCSISGTAEDGAGFCLVPL